MQQRKGPTSRKEFMLPDMDSTFRVFAAHWRTVEPEWTYPLHKHPLFEVNLVLSGMQEMTVNGRQYRQRQGDLIVLNPGDKHESRAVGGEAMTYYCLHFDVDERSFRELLLQNGECYHPAGSELAVAIKPALAKLVSLTTEEAAMRVEARMITLSAMFELFAALSGTLSKRNRSEEGTRRSAVASQAAAMLEQAVEHAAGGESGVETVQAIAEALGYSMSALNRLFSQAYGMSPRQYVSHMMLKKAKLLLMDHELTIEAISAELGYRTIAHFSRQFKRWTDEPPSQFRARFHE
ncbi:AraC family transcriptional regulator [Paenibacillus sp. NEAU-GSW1]|uniref:helix-turn-helix domain-containing protein n=1 Tax=Paenibacillus sp. NEAU-GSW1 TaxID=2682486 RepID=UPI0012E313A1|nr:AraC family transcriptional regulator [Paenibacillus sp. NEAU-GSW1]MUT68799.1 helix-turn-helix domain-containing protein [Paenibacillus sp. NEAU-GSW1]